MTIPAPVLLLLSAELWYVVVRMSGCCRPIPEIDEKEL
jgi:hypothetical protein